VRGKRARHMGCGASKLHSLYQACIDGDVERVEDLLASGVSPHFLIPETNNTLLHLSAINDKGKVCKALIEAGANPNARNIDGHTPLMECSIRGGAKAAKALLDNGAKPNKRAAYRNTALHLASKKGRSDVVQVFCEAECKLGIRGQNGYTPLHYAVVKGHAETVQVLLEFGASPKQRNAYGQDCDELANVKGYSNDETRALLKEDAARARFKKAGIMARMGAKTMIKAADDG